ncbi:hypothetical protein INR49_028838 [Caranx melampygus]|nr:hypothetical protein INR49_028838 [Caranx melampygus]
MRLCGLQCVLQEAVVVRHIHPTKRLRVCCLCHKTEEFIQEITHQTERRCVKDSSEEDEVEGSSEEEETGEQMGDHHPSRMWFECSSSCGWRTSASPRSAAAAGRHIMTDRTPSCAAHWTKPPAPLP